MLILVLLLPSYFFASHMTLQPLGEISVSPGMAVQPPRSFGVLPGIRCCSLVLLRDNPSHAANTEEPIFSRPSGASEGLRKNYAQSIPSNLPSGNRQLVPFP